MKKAMLLLLTIVLMLPGVSTYAIHSTTNDFTNRKKIEQQLGRKLNIKEKIGLAILKKSLKKSAKKQILSTSSSTACDEITFVSGKTLKVEIKKMTTHEVTYITCGNKQQKTTVPLDEIIQIRSATGILIYESKVEDITYATHTTSQTQAKTDTFAILSFVFTLTFILIPLGFIFGLVSLRRIKKYPERYKGKAFALIGTILSGVVLAIYLIALIAFLSFGL